MFPTDELNEVLEGVVDTETEDALLIEGYGKKTWGIDWRNGRLFKANETQTKVERAIKYLVTPRGQVEVYQSPDIDLNDFDDGYGSLAWTLMGRVYDDEESAQSDLQALCDEAALNTTGVEEIVVDALTLEEDRLIARIRVVVESGEEVLVDGVNFTN